MYIYEPTLAMEEKLIEVFSDLSQEQSSSDGTVRFIYPEIIERIDGAITNQTMLSGVLNHYRESGVLERVKRGGPTTPSVWDVSSLIEKSTTEQEAPALSSTEVAPIPTEEVGPENQESLHEITNTLTSMMEFLQSIPSEMLPTIQTFHSQVSNLKNGKDEKLEARYAELKSGYAELEARYEELANDYADKIEDIQSLEREKNGLAAQVAHLEGQVEVLKTSTPSFNAHRIYRSRNLILDEIERYFSKPGWERKTKSEHVRMVVSNQLDFIIKELNIKEGTSV